MKESSNLLKSIMLLAGAGMLGACGGGGGGDTAISASDPVSVTSANAATVAGAAVNSADGLSGSSAGALGVFPASVGETTGVQIAAIDTVLQQVRRAPEILASGSSQVTAAAVQPINEPCDSGSISGSFNDADNDLTLSTGDSLSMTANSCSFGGVVMNGSISISNIVVNGDLNSSAFRLQLSMQASNFSVTVGSETVSMNGGATISESSGNGIVSTRFVTDGMQIGIPGDTVALFNYVVETTENEATLENTLDISGVISSTSLGGSVVCTTEQLLKGIDSANPYEGVIVCTGADNTRVTLNAMSDSTKVELLVDEDGDGVTDNIIPMLWDDL